MPAAAAETFVRVAAVVAVVIVIAGVVSVEFRPAVGGGLADVVPE